MVGEGRGVLENGGMKEVMEEVGVGERVEGVLIENPILSLG